MPRKAALSHIVRLLQGVPLTRASSARDGHGPTGLAMTKTNNIDLALTNYLSFGVARFYYVLNAIVGALLKAPLPPKDQDIFAILLLGLFQLKYSRMPAHAAIHETVALVPVKKKWAKGLVNAILRQYQKEAASIEAKLQKQVAFSVGAPGWLWKILVEDNGVDTARTIMQTLLSEAPMILRIDLHRITREAYLAQLLEQQVPAEAHPDIPSAIILAAPCDPATLPGFNEGLVFIQDGNAQRAAYLLNPLPGQSVLDACAAPGGKSIHLWQHLKGNIALTCVDNHEGRMETLRENLARAGSTPLMIVGDATTLTFPHSFDAILLDAPCSGTGVIRRHPDIMQLRSKKMVADLMLLQAALLDALWKNLKAGGILLYATCSILKSENEQQITHFLARTPDATLTFSEQYLPNEKGDGFYYARLEKGCAVGLGISLL